MSSPKNRARVLLVAYACRPGESSEREVGWRWANLIGASHDVTVLTRTTHRPYIEAEIARSSVRNTSLEFIYYDLPSWAGWFKRGERGLLSYYVLWSLFATRLSRQLNRNDRWQITHFLTFGTLLWPQFTWRSNTAHYVLGPIGGGERIPMKLRSSFGLVGQVKIVVRWVSQQLVKISPNFNANLERADKVFVRTKETYDFIPSRYRHKTELLLETAISPDVLDDCAKKLNNDRLEIVSVGRLIPSKFNPLFLESLATFKAAWRKPFRVTIIGDGPERRRLEDLRDKMGLDEVVFVGKKDPGTVLTTLRGSDIYFSTTMKEGGTWAFFEAIACCVPIVCLKVNGPDMIVGDGCGVKVEPSNHADARAGLADGLLKLASDPSLRVEYAERAHDWVEKTYSLKNVVARINASYDEVLRKLDPRR